MKPDPGLSTIMTTQEVTEWLGINRKTLYSAVATGEIPARKIGRKYLFSRSAIMAWLTMQGRVALER